MPPSATSFAAEDIEIANEMIRARAGSGGSGSDNNGRCGTGGCLVPEIRADLRLQRQMEDKHYWTLIQIVVGCTVATCSLMITLAAAIIKFH